MGFSNQGWFPVRGVASLCRKLSTFRLPSHILPFSSASGSYRKYLRGNSVVSTVELKPLSPAGSSLWHMQYFHSTREEAVMTGCSRLEEGQERPYSDNIPHIELGNS